MSKKNILAALAVTSLVFLCAQACTSKRKQAEIAIRTQLDGLLEVATVSEPMPLVQAAIRSKQVEKFFSRDLKLKIRNPESGQVIERQGSQELAQIAVAVWQRYRVLSLKSESIIVAIDPELTQASVSLRLLAFNAKAEQLGNFALTLEFVFRDKTWLISNILETH